MRIAIARRVLRRLHGVQQRIEQVHATTTNTLRQRIGALQLPGHGGCMFGEPLRCAAAGRRGRPRCIFRCRYSGSNKDPDRYRADAAGRVTSGSMKTISASISRPRAHRFRERIARFDRNVDAALFVRRDRRTRSPTSPAIAPGLADRCLRASRAAPPRQSRAVREGCAAAARLRTPRGRELRENR